jgi:cellulose synthase/poly-beta-1,6-N-acetylglucosamine synthase-like glycosyltransferase
MNFSVLMSIYYKEKPEYFDRCMKSIWDEQIIKPSEIVLVEDGKLTEELCNVINNWKSKLGSILKIIPLEKNMGLGDALNIGLSHCKYEIVARMDTDDIALPNRFKKQLDIFKNLDIDVCGSWVGEFEKDENNIISYRKVPESHEKIVVFFKLRNAINHPSVMYKKSMVNKAGGYKRMLWFEDYYLWIRMILNGAKFYNIQEPLVKMRVDNQLERRKGKDYILNEIKLQKKFLELNFINKKEFIINIFIRNLPRLLPFFILKNLYKKFLRN